MIFTPLIRILDFYTKQARPTEKGKNSINPYLFDSQKKPTRNDGP